MTRSDSEPNGPRADDAVQPRANEDAELEDLPIEEAIDALYRAPLSGFTEARNDLAKRLKSRGRSDDAALVGTLAKPSLSAWGVNQLVWHSPATYAALIRAGDELRVAERQSLAGAEALIGDTRLARDDAIRDAMSAIQQSFDAAGQPLTEAVGRRIMASLDAVASYGSHYPTPPPGRLFSDVAPPGFAELAVLAATPLTPLTARPDTTGEPKAAPPFSPTATASRARAQPTPAASARSAEQAAKHDAARRRLLAKKSVVDKATAVLERRQTQMADALRALEIVRASLSEAEARVEDLKTAHAEVNKQVAAAQLDYDRAQAELETES